MAHDPDARIAEVVGRERSRLLNFIRSNVHDDVERAFRPRYSYKAFVPMSRRDVMTGKIPA